MAGGLLQSRPLAARCDSLHPRRSTPIPLLPPACTPLCGQRVAMLSTPRPVRLFAGLATTTPVGVAAQAVGDLTPGNLGTLTLRLTVLVLVAPPCLSTSVATTALAVGGALAMGAVRERVFALQIAHVLSSPLCRSRYSIIARNRAGSSFACPMAWLQWLHSKSRRAPVSWSWSTWRRRVGLSPQMAQRPC